jgi:hypothetical protein
MTERSREMAAAKKTGDAAKKTVTRRRKKVTPEMIEERAYMISLGETAGSPLDNWLAAERELLGA